MFRWSDPDLSHRIQRPNTSGINVRGDALETVATGQLNIQSTTLQKQVLARKYRCAAKVQFSKEQKCQEWTSVSPTNLAWSTLLGIRPPDPV